MIFGWVETLTENDCIVCFKSSELEEEVMKALLYRRIPTILVVMNKFTDVNDMQIRKAREEGRLLIITLQRDEPRGKGQTPRLRNEYVIRMVDDIVCGYIDKNGSIFPLLAGLKNVTYIEELEFHGVAEDMAPTHQRWKVWEDKTLLRLFYEDMGIYAIKQALRRTYQSIRTRTRAITLPEEVLKGREFEDFVLELFDLSDKQLYSLIEWRSDKTIGDISPVSNSYPDFVIEYGKGVKKVKFAVECKWRASLSLRFKQQLLPQEQIDRYKEYSVEKRQRVVVVLGVGGEPSMPEELYLIPLESLQQSATSATIQQYRREVVSKWFEIEEFCPEI